MRKTEKKGRKKKLNRVNEGKKMWWLGRKKGLKERKNKAGERVKKEDNSRESSLCRHMP